jgi:hypothetical protein
MDYIQREVIWNINATRPSSVELTFQHWGGMGAARDDDRWDSMALRIRNAYQTLRQHTHGHPNFMIEMIAGDERARAPINRPFGNVMGVTGEALSGFFEQMLQSDETLELEGLVVVVKLVGEDMQNPVAQGRGRSLGMKLIPSHLKNKGNGLLFILGLMIHPQSESRAKELEEIGLCGPRALLLTRYKDMYAKDFNALLFDSKLLGIQLGLVDGIMKHEDVENLVKLPDWTMTRVVIFSIAGTKTFEAQGPRWKWPEDQPRIQPDPQTIPIMYDPVERHYWAIAGMKTLVFNHRCGSAAKGVKRIDCHCCFVGKYGEEKFNAHNCVVQGLHHCRICKTPFSYAAWDRHNGLKRTDLSCDCCGQTVFNGQDCFDRHMLNNCTPPTNFTAERCNICHRKFISGKEEQHTHVFPKCRHCGLKFGKDDYQLYKQHRCYLSRLEKFWPQVDESENPKWASHWFYDFETCRGAVVGEKQYQHEVMAWCMQLMILDDEEMIRKNEWLENIASQLELVISGKYTDVEYEFVMDPLGNTIRIFGKKLESFIQTVEQVLHTPKWTPILWAHNGSKFDVKFILDYYLNELGYDLGGDVYEEDEPGSFKKVEHAKRRHVCAISAVGSKVLQLKVNDITFRCSHAHMAMELRRMPSVFGLDSLLVKGEFPYGRMAQDAWGNVHEQGLPPLEEYEPNNKITSRRHEIISWWSLEQQRRNVAMTDILLQLAVFNDIEDIIEQVVEHYDQKEGPTESWNFTDELWKYLYADVNVGARCMEKYHMTSVDMHKPIWLNYPQHNGHLVSPLQYPTAPGWANAMYRTWFVPEETCAILRPPEASYVRDSLHGGRTDKRANIVSLTPERRALGDRIVYVDFKSLYPSVQDASIHETYFPVGAPKWIKNPEDLVSMTDWSGRIPWLGQVTNESMLTMMENKTGFLTVNTKVKKFVTHPTLSRLGSNDENDVTLKLLFENKDHRNATFAWPELEEAIRAGEIDVTFLNEGLLFDKGTNVFEEYVQFFFKMKQDAEDVGNKGLRELAKLLLNSLWGKLGQRSYPCREWVQDAARLDFLIKEIESGRYELCKLENRESHRVWIQYRVVKDLNNLSNTAYQLAAFVSMWGRVMLHRKVLSVHGQRVLYCDTDSGIIYLRAGDEMRWMGDKIGDLTDEVPGMVKGKGFVDPYIDEAVFIAPKTYALQIRCAVDPEKIYHKVVCKGFESSYAGSSNLNFESMKELVNDKFKITKRKDCDGQELPERKRIEGVPRLQFRSSMANNTITPVETTIVKNIEGEYTKGRVHPTDKRLIVPFGDWEPQGSFLDFEKVDDKYIDYE